jgi:hypothetical protein
VETPAREPPNAPHVPWVFDVFAAENNSRAVFIAQVPRPCYTHYRTPDFDMAGKVRARDVRRPLQGPSGLP